MAGAWTMGNFNQVANCQSNIICIVISLLVCRSNLPYVRHLANDINVTVLGRRCWQFVIAENQSILIPLFSAITLASPAVFPSTYVGRTRVSAG